MKLRIRLEEIEIEWGTGKDARDGMSPGTAAFVTAAAPFVVKWLEKQGFTWWDRKDAAPASGSTPQSSEPAATDDAQVVDGAGPFTAAMDAAARARNSSAAAAEV